MPHQLLLHCPMSCDALLMSLQSCPAQARASSVCAPSVSNLQKTKIQQSVCRVQPASAVKGALSSKSSVICRTRPLTTTTVPACARQGLASSTSIVICVLWALSSPSLATRRACPATSTSLLQTAQAACDAHQMQRPGQAQQRARVPRRTQCATAHALSAQPITSGHGETTGPDHALLVLWRRAATLFLRCSSAQVHAAAPLATKQCHQTLQAYSPVACAHKTISRVPAPASSVHQGLPPRQAATLYMRACATSTQQHVTHSGWTARALASVLPRHDSVMRACQDIIRINRHPQETLSDARPARRAIISQLTQLLSAWRAPLTSGTLA